jgi:hypothetical protein
VNERVEKLVEKYCTHKFVIDGGKVCASREQLRAAIVEARREALKEARRVIIGFKTVSCYPESVRTYNLGVDAMAEALERLAGEEGTK